MNFDSDVVIGLEVHIELDTITKLFCGCKRKQNNIPNTQVCPICLGYPGTRPLLNKKALNYAIKLAFALDCSLAKKLIFSRKSYFYPDMSKNFQITQFEQPLGSLGKLQLKSGKTINIKRLHLEEDPASLVYPKSISESSYSLIDYNRSGNSLLEVVTEPELRSPEEAREFLNHLVSILTYLKIFDLESCIIKVDANISIKESEYQRVEIKNISGIKEIEKALRYEIVRQKNILRRNLKINKETRGWDATTKSTILLRKKESEDDYGYILEPDLPIISITEEMISLLKKEVPELAQQKAEKYIKEFGIDRADAQVMSMELELAELFEKVAEKIDPKFAAMWLRKELLRVINCNKKSVKDILFDEKEIIELLTLIQNKSISRHTARRILEKLIEKRFSPKEYAEKNGLMLISSNEKLKEICRKVISENKKAVKDYLSGKEKSYHYLIGEAMKLSKGKADPKITNKIMKTELKKKC